MIPDQAMRGIQDRACEGIHTEREWKAHRALSPSEKKDGSPESSLHGEKAERSARHTGPRV